MLRARLPGGICTPAQWLAIDRIGREHGLLAEGHSPLRLSAIACVAFPTCPKAMAESELQSANARLDRLDPKARIAWARDQLPSALALSSSFGVQAAVMLHLTNQIIPRIPVIVIDTGYLFPETYRFIDDLTTRLDLNLRV